MGSKPNAETITNSVQILSRNTVDGCITPPTLFKSFLHQTLLPLKQECRGMGDPVRSGRLRTLRFADDRAIVVQDKDDLTYMLRKLE